MFCACLPSLSSSGLRYTLRSDLRRLSFLSQPALTGLILPCHRIGICESDLQLSIRRPVEFLELCLCWYLILTSVFCLLFRELGLGRGRAKEKYWTSPEKGRRVASRTHDPTIRNLSFFLSRSSRRFSHSHPPPSKQLLGYILEMLGRR